MLFIIKYWKYSLLFLFLATLTFGIKEEVEGFIIAGAVGAGLILYIILMKSLLKLTPKQQRDKIIDSKALEGRNILYDELAGIVEREKIAQIINKIVLIVFALIIICPFIIPSYEKRSSRHDEIVVIRINEEIIKKNFEQVELLIPLLKLPENQIKYKSILQSYILKEGIESVRKMIENKSFGVAKIELAKLRWEFISGPQGWWWFLEKNYYFNFTELLKSTNYLLPIQFQSAEISAMKSFNEEN